MPTDITWWDRILGTWAIAAGVSLVYSFVRVYRLRSRYLYLLCFALWASVWGVDRFQARPLVPGATLRILFWLGVALMLLDSVRRYRETTARLRRERLERLKGP